MLGDLPYYPTGSSVRQSIDPGDGAIRAMQDWRWKTFDQPIVMGRKENGCMVMPGQIADQFRDLITGLGVKVAGRFIGEEQPWLIQKGPGDGQPLLLPSGKLGRIAKTIGRKLRFVQYPGDPLRTFLSGGPTRRSQNKVQVLIDSFLAKQQEILEDDAQLSTESMDLVSG